MRRNQLVTGPENSTDMSSQHIVQLERTEDNGALIQNPSGSQREETTIHEYGLCKLLAVDWGTFSSPESPIQDLSAKKQALEDRIAEISQEMIDELEAEQMEWQKIRAQRDLNNEQEDDESDEEYDLIGNIRESTKEEVQQSAELQEHYRRIQYPKLYDPDISSEEYAYVLGLKQLREARLNAVSQILKYHMSNLRFWDAYEKGVSDELRNQLKSISCTAGYDVIKLLSIFRESLEDWVEKIHALEKATGKPVSIEIPEIPEIVADIRKKDKMVADIKAETQKIHEKIKKKYFRANPNGVE